MTAGKACGSHGSARLLLQTAVEDYPEDPQREAARQRLQALGGPVEKTAPRAAAPPATGAGLTDFPGKREADVARGFTPRAAGRPEASGAGDKPPRYIGAGGTAAR